MHSHRGRIATARQRLEPVSGRRPGPWITVAALELAARTAWARLVATHPGEVAAVSGFGAMLDPIGSAVHRRRRVRQLCRAFGFRKPGRKSRTRGRRSGAGGCPATGQPASGSGATGGGTRQVASRGARPGARRLGARCPGARRPGPRRPGFRRPGFRRPGFRRPGFRRPGFRRPGFRRPGFRRPGPGRGTAMPGHTAPRRSARPSAPGR